MKLEKKLKDQYRENSYRRVGIFLFLVVMILGCILGLCISLRPKESELEKRKLTEFPKFTWESFWNGDYTAQINTWYADTYPFREGMLTAEMHLKQLHGLNRDAINNTGDGDDVPDIDDMISSISEEESRRAESDKETSKESEAPTQTQGSEGTDGQSSEETPAPTSPTRATEDPNAVASEGEDIARMNPQEAGQVNVLDLVGYCVYGFNLKAADHYCENVATVADGLAGITDVYTILIPDNSAIQLPDEIKQQWKLSDERKVLDYYKARLELDTPNATDIDIYNTLMEHKDEYLYFKTDHHWTQLGAYYAYVEYCKAAGFTPNPLDAYQTEVTTPFLGSYYVTNGFTQLEANPDTITAYVPLTINNFSFYDTAAGTMRSGKLIRNMSEFGPSVGYLGFIYGDNPYSVIENPNVHNGRSCIVVKESFGNAWIPFLADHYERIIVIDYRSYKDSVIDLAKQEKITDLVFINNLEAISDVWIMDVLGNICR